DTDHTDGTASASTLLLAGQRALFDEGNLRASRGWFDAAYRAPEREGNADLQALAALGLGGLWLHEHRRTSTSAVVEARQRHALQLVDADSPLAHRLRIRLTAEAD